MNSKKAITLLILATLIMAMVPAIPMASAADLEAGVFTFDNLDHATWTNRGEKGQQISVESPVEAVAPGYEVSIYWGKIQAWDGEKGLLNTSGVDDDGSFEIWFEVPEAVQKDDWSIWFTATDQAATRRETFDIETDCDVSSSSGLADSKVYVDLWGFDDNEDAGILFVVDDGAAAPEAIADWNTEVVAAEIAVADADAGDQFDDIQLDHYPVAGAIGALTLSVGADDLGTWNGAVWAAAGDGGSELDPADCTIVEATGVFSFGTAAALGADDQVDVAYTAAIAPIAGEATGETGVVDADDDGTAANGMIEPGTFVITGAGGGTASDDNSDGKLYDAGGDDIIGSVDYITGEWSFDNDDSTDAEDVTGVLTLAYQYFDDIGNYCYVLASSGMTNDLGTWENKRVTIPDAVEDQYYIFGMDGDGNTAFDDYEIGAIISLSEDSGPVGSKIEIEGAGFDVGDEVAVTIDGVDAHIIDSEDAPGGPDDDIVDANGEFVIEVIIPQVSDDDEFDIVCTATPGGQAPTATFEVTDLASISVDPDFGPQGSTVTVTGENFSVDKADIEIWLTTTGGADVIEIDSITPDADGTFSADITVPTENDDSYKIEARTPADDDGTYDIADDTDFRIGTILVLLSKDEAVVGDRIVLTGNGFTNNGEWNATFGDTVIFSEENANANGLLKVDGDTPEFFVPQLPVGDYVITVWDSDAEIVIETDFTITTYTTLEFSTLEAPNDFNVTIDGWYWPEVDGVLNANADIEFVLWNATDEWDMVVDQRDNAGHAVIHPAVLNATGYLVDAYWMVPDDDTLSKGTYHINATIETDNDQSYEMFLDFVVGDVYEVLAPRKATFRVGDTVSFVVEHSFGGQVGSDYDDSDLIVYDPSGNVYWEIDALDAADWFSSGEFWTLKAAAQTDGGNPCILLDDAPLGEWSVVWEDDGGDEVLDATFMVEASAEDVVNEAVADLANDVADLAGQLTDVAGEFDSVSSDIADVAAVAAQAVEAANAAAEAVTAVAGTANEASQAAADAATAAEAARDAASGLTTLVYGAIGAALVAALAAIVSLMQISRRIAG